MAALVARISARRANHSTTNPSNKANRASSKVVAPTVAISRVAVVAIRAVVAILVVAVLVVQVGAVALVEVAAVIRHHQRSKLAH